MRLFRWLRWLAICVLGALLLAPSLALPLSIFVDRGPTDEARISPHLFPIALWIFDDFAWTCVAIA